VGERTAGSSSSFRGPEWRRRVRRPHTEVVTVDIAIAATGQWRVDGSRGRRDARPPPTSPYTPRAWLNPTPGTLVLAIVWGCIPQCIACALSQLLIVSICYVDICCSLVDFEKIIYDMHECVNHIRKIPCGVSWTYCSYFVLLFCVLKSSYFWKSS
jgi:hypothetical protein